MSLPDRRLVLFLLLGGVFGQRHAGVQHSEALVHILVHGDSPARWTKAGK